MMRMLKAANLFTGVLVLTLSVFLLTLVQLAELEIRLKPVTSDWTATNIWADGDDLMVYGHMVKRRDCSYIPPPRAVSSEGRPLLVVSYAANKQSSWPASPDPVFFGPWRVVGGAGKIVDFTQEYRCHFAWPLFMYQGRVDGIQLRQMPGKD